MLFSCELQTVKTHSNYFQILYCLVADFMPFRRKCTIMDPANWDPRSDHVISDYSDSILMHTVDVVTGSDVTT